MGDYDIEMGIIPNNVRNTPSFCASDSDSTTSFNTGMNGLDIMAKQAKRLADAAEKRLASELDRAELPTSPEIYDSVENGDYGMELPKQGVEFMRSRSGNLFASTLNSLREQLGTED